MLILAHRLTRQQDVVKKMICHLLVCLLVVVARVAYGDLTMDANNGQREWKPIAVATATKLNVKHGEAIHFHDDSDANDESSSSGASHDLHSIERRTKQLRNLLYDSAAYGSLALSALVFSVACYLCYASHDSVVRRQLNDRRHNVQPIAITYKKRQ